MKKVLSLIFLLLFSFGLIACNGELSSTINTQNTSSTTETTTVDDTQGTQTETTTGVLSQIDYPKNLVLTDTVLTWDAVDDAVGYYVYADGTEVAHVTTNTYTFTVTTESRIVFTVVAEAPAGMMDSAESAQVAYVANSEDEIASMKLAVSGSMMPFGDEFATELVNKGMLTTEFSAMNLAVTGFMSSMETATDIDSIYTSLDTMLGSMDNLEPLISALVIHVLPQALDDEILSLQTDLTYYQDMLTMYPEDYYYQEMVTETQAEIVMVQDIKAQIALSEEDVIMTIMIVIDYLMEFESLVSANLITYLDNLAMTVDAASLNVSELVLIKDEIVYILTESMPSQADLALVTQTLFTFMDLIAENQGLEMAELAAPEKLAASMLVGFELGIEFMDTISQADFQTFKEIAISTDSENMKSAHMAVLFLNIFDTFFDKAEVATLKTQMSNIYTETEKETMFNDAIDSLEAMLLEQETPFDLSMLTFERMMDLMLILDDATDEILDALVASEGEIILIAAERGDWEQGFYENPVWNELEYQYYNQHYTLLILDQVFYILNSVASQRTMAEFEEVRSLLFDSLSLIMPTIFGDQPVFMDDLLMAIEAFLTTTSEEQYDLIQSLFAYLDEEDIFLEYANNYETAFGTNMESIYDTGGHFAFVEIVSIYYGFMQDSTDNNTNINALITGLDTMFSLPVFVDNELVPFDIDLIIQARAYVDTIALEVSSFDSTNLTEAQITRINDIMDAIDVIMQGPAVE